MPEIFCKAQCDCHISYCYYLRYTCLWTLGWTSIAMPLSSAVFGGPFFVATEATFLAFVWNAISACYYMNSNFLFDIFLHTFIIYRDAGQFVAV